MIEVNEQSDRPTLLAAAKERGVSGAGTNEAILTRIREADAQAAADDDDPLGLDDEPKPAPGASAHNTTPETSPDADQGASPASGDQPAIDPEHPVNAPAPAPNRKDPNVSDETTTAEQDTDPDGGVVHDGRAFRAAFPVGPHAITDAMHFGWIADTHHLAQEAGHTTRGGETVGERVRFSTDANGRRTVVYQVAIKRRR